MSLNSASFPLQASELTLSVFEQAPMGICLLDFEGRIQYANELSCLIMGHAREDLVPRLMAEVMVAEDLPLIEQKVQALFEGDASQVALEKRYVQEDGQIVWVSSHIKLFRDLTGQPQGIICMMEDVTEKVGLRQRLNEKERRYEALFQQSGDGIGIHDLEGNILEVNEKACELLEYTKEELTQMHVSQIHPPIPEVIEAGLQALEKVKQTGKACFSTQFLSKTGNLIYGKGYLTLVNLGVEQIVQVVFRDETAQRMAEDAWQQKALAYQALFDQSGDGIGLIDMQGKFLVVNQRLADIFGYTVAEFEQLSIPDTHPPTEEIIARCNAAVVETLNAGEAVFENLFLTKTGQQLQGEVRMTLTQWEGETVLQAIFKDISEQKRALAALKSQEAQYRALFEHAGDGVIIRDLNGDILSANQSICQMLGYTKDELNQMNITSLIVPREDLGQFMDLSNEILQKGEKNILEVSLRRKDGSEWVGEVYAKILKIGQTPIIQSIIRDVTERNAARKAIQESEALLRSIMEGADAWITLLDLEGRIQYANRGTPYYPKAQMKGQFIETILKLKGEMNWPDIRTSVLANQNPLSFESCFDPKVSGTYNLFSTINPVFEEGIIVGFTVIINDLTELNETKAKHQKALEINRLTTNAAQIGVFEWDLAVGDEIYWDDTVNRIFGMNPGVNVWPLQAFVDILHPEDKERIIQQIQDSVAAVRDDVASYRIIRQDDQGMRWIWEQWFFEKDDAGNALNIRGILWDQTEEKKRQDMEIRNAQLEAQNQELKAFTYIASHDLQSPLRTINNYVGLFLEDYKDQVDDQGKWYLEVVMQGARRMHHLIKDLLDYSRIGMKRQKSSVDLAQLMKALQVDLAHEITTHQARISIGDLPTIEAYQTELRLLFQNLLSNAIKFRKKDEAPVIHIKAHETEEEWVFSVKDNGIGIEEVYYEKIFQVFQRLHKREDYEGTGIGLAHCAKVANLHNGRIWVESELGKGSTFFVAIPIDA